MAAAAAACAVVSGRCGHRPIAHSDVGAFADARSCALQVSTFHTDHIFIAYHPPSPRCTATSTRLLRASHAWLQVSPGRAAALVAARHVVRQRVLVDVAVDANGDAAHAHAHTRAHARTRMCARKHAQVRAAMAFPGRILANPHLEVINAQSRPYPRRQRKCEASVCLSLRPPHAHMCCIATRLLQCTPRPHVRRVTRPCARCGRRLCASALRAPPHPPPAQASR